MTSDSDYEDVVATSKDVIGTDRGNVTIEWTLNRAPDKEWAQYLVYSGTPKSGSLSFVMTEPVVTGSRIRMTVPDADLESAARWVDGSILEANEKFRRFVMPKRREEAERIEQNRLATQNQLDSARQRLRKLTD